MTTMTADFLPEPLSGGVPTKVHNSGVGHGLVSDSSSGTDVYKTFGEAI